MNVPKLTSNHPAYKFFEAGVLIPDKEKPANKNNFAYKCKTCGGEKSCRINTPANLDKHLQRCFKKPIHEQNKLLYATMKTEWNSCLSTPKGVKRIRIDNKENSEPEYSTPVQSRSMLDFGVETVKVRKYNRQGPTQKERYYNLMKMLIRCMLPISIVENPAFVEFYAQIDPYFHMPTRETIKATGLPELRIVVETRMKNELKSIPYPNCSIDGWSDRTTESLQRVRLFCNFCISNKVA